MGVSYASPFNNGGEDLLSVGGTFYRGGEGSAEVVASLVQGMVSEAEARNLVGVNLDGLTAGDADVLRSVLDPDGVNSPIRLSFEDCEGISGLAGDLRLRVRDIEQGAETREGVYVRPITKIPDYLIEAFIHETHAPHRDRQKTRDSPIKVGAFNHGFLTGFVAATTRSVVDVTSIYVEPCSRGVITEGEPTAGEKLMQAMILEARARGLEGVDIGPLAEGGLHLFERMAGQNQALGEASDLVFEELPEDECIYGEIRFKK
ncbi:MAG: hypothetical protein ABH834_04900 [Candidatus Altiarchaeota archaeon]